MIIKSTVVLHKPHTKGHPCTVRLPHPACEKCSFLSIISSTSQLAQTIFPLSQDASGPLNQTAKSPASPGSSIYPARVNRVMSSALGLVDRTRSNVAVGMIPGCRLTATRSDRSAARCSISLMTATFDELYAEDNAAGSRLGSIRIDPAVKLMIVGLTGPDVRTWGKNADTVFKVPLTLVYRSLSLAIHCPYREDRPTCSTLHQASRFSPMTLGAEAAPALLTSTSHAPTSAATLPIATSSSMSAAWTMTDSIGAPFSRQTARTFSSRASSRPKSTIFFAPALAKLFAISLPIPPEAPVMTTTLPDALPIGSMAE